MPRLSKETDNYGKIVPSVRQKATIITRPRPHLDQVGGSHVGERERESQADMIQAYWRVKSTGNHTDKSKEKQACKHRDRLSCTDRGKYADRQS